MQQIPLPERADEITAEWMRQALTSGGISDFPEIDALEIEKLSDVTNALGNLFRCRLSTRDGTAAYPASVIVKFVNQTRELLGRTLTAIEELDAGEFLPTRANGPFSILSRGGFKAYTFLLGLRKGKAD